jgi:hypothetical protein
LVQGIKLQFYKNDISQTKGSILLETLIAIILLGLIVFGSFYSYSIVFERIKTKRTDRIILGLLQGWMEYTLSYLTKHHQICDNSNELLQVTDDLQKEFRQQVIGEKEFSRIFTSGGYDYPNIGLECSDRIIRIEIWVPQNGSNIKLITRRYLKQP